MFQRILVPHDGSTFAEQVLPYAVELARLFAGEIHLVEVIENPNPAIYAADLDAGLAVPATIEAVEEALDAVREQGRERLRTVAAQLGSQGIRATWTILDGDPATEIIKYEQEHDVDLVTMATHGRSGLEKLVMGSVTEKVLRDGGRPVLVIRAREPEA